MVHRWDMLKGGNVFVKDGEIRGFEKKKLDVGKYSFKSLPVPRITVQEHLLPPWFLLLHHRLR